MPFDKLRFISSNNNKLVPLFSVTAHGEVYSIQHYVIKFVSDLRQVDN